MVTLLPCLAAAKPKGKVDAPSEVAAVRVQVPQRASPLDAQFSWPSLRGSDEGLDITRMVRSRVRFGITFDRSWLAMAGVPARHVVLAVLEADPRWRVSDVEGPLAGTWRQSGDDGWQVPRTGFHASSTERWRVQLRLEAWPNDHVWATSERVVRVQADDSPIDLQGYVDDAGTGIYGARTTVLSIQGPLLGLDIYEMGPDTGRPRTLDALPKMADQVGRILIRLTDIEESGVDEMPLPPGEPSSGAWIKVEAPELGVLDIRGRVNPGVSGWTWVRLVGPSGTWAESEVGSGTRERIGWDDDPTRSFWIQGAFAAPSGPGFPATAEVWTQPDDGRDAIRVAEFPVVVPAR